VGRILAGQRQGMAGIVLVLLIVTALGAVIMLTGTLVAARKINDSVKLINPRVQGIAHNTRAVDKAKHTMFITAKISDTLTPLPAQLAAVVQATGGIDGHSHAILRRARSINATVRSIDGHVHAINATAHGILGNSSAINSGARGVNASAHGINGHVSSVFSNAKGINADVRAINGSAGGIRSTFGRLLPVVRAIDGAKGKPPGSGFAGNKEAGIKGTFSGITGINTRADGVISLVTPVATELTGTANLVGPGHTQDSTDKPSIHGYANMIDCSTLIKTTRALGTALGSGMADFCGK
jgi:hypothetical protein